MCNFTCPMIFVTRSIVESSTATTVDSAPRNRPEDFSQGMSESKSSFGAPSRWRAVPVRSGSFGCGVSDCSQWLEAHRVLGGEHGAKSGWTMPGPPLFACLEDADGMHAAGVARQQVRFPSAAERVLDQILRTFLAHDEDPMGDDAVDEDFGEEGLPCFQCRVNRFVFKRRAKVHIDFSGGQF